MNKDLNDEMGFFIQRGMELNKRISVKRAKAPYSNQDEVIEVLELECKVYEQQPKLYIEKIASK